MIAITSSRRGDLARIAHPVELRKTVDRMASTCSMVTAAPRPTPTSSPRTTLTSGANAQRAGSNPMARWMPNQARSRPPRSSPKWQPCGTARTRARVLTPRRSEDLDLPGISPIDDNGRPRLPWSTTTWASSPTCTELAGTNQGLIAEVRAEAAWGVGFPRVRRWSGWRVIARSAGSSLTASARSSTWGATRVVSIG